MSQIVNSPSGLCGLDAYAVDLSKDKAFAITSVTIVQEIINDDGFRKIFAIGRKSMAKYSPEFVHFSRAAAEEFYDHAKPLRDKIMETQKNHEKQIDQLWAEIGITKEFQGLVSRIKQIVG